ncbi:MAG: hypothetical protein IT199_07380, partial [Solirubrobacterales bacterium]|nr:hypothetical protein [Solirubrobacterales bacterium]
MFKLQEEEKPTAEFPSALPEEREQERGRRGGAWTKLLATVAACKCLYLLAVAAAVWAWGGLDIRTFDEVIHWPREGQPSFASHFATWDSAHYLHLSEVGYNPGAPSCAFYPLWPLVVRSLAPTAAGNHVLTGILLANVLSIFAWCIFYRIVRVKVGRSAALWSLAFLVAFP